MKSKLIHIVLLLMICILFIFPFVLLVQNYFFGPSPKAAVCNFFDAIESSDISKAQKYLDKDNTILTFNNLSNKNVVMRVFSMLDYEVISVEKSNDTAVAKVKITTPDMEFITNTVLQEVMTKLSKTINNGEEVETSESEAMTEEYYLQMLSDKNVTMTTTELGVTLNKQGNRWIIAGDDYLKKAITGNMVITQD